MFFRNWVSLNKKKRKGEKESKNVLIDKIRNSCKDVFSCRGHLLRRTPRNNFSLKITVIPGTVFIRLKNIKGKIATTINNNFFFIFTVWVGYPSFPRLVKKKKKLWGWILICFECNENRHRDVGLFQWKIATRLQTKQMLTTWENVLHEWRFFVDDNIILFLLLFFFFFFRIVTLSSIYCLRWKRKNNIFTMPSSQSFDKFPRPQARTLKIK